MIITNIKPYLQKALDDVKQKNSFKDSKIRTVTLGNTLISEYNYSMTAQQIRKN
ncbi:hypothetical protein [Candidatus Phytoplasma solani]|uniref:hypothetical protein n=1 Tax=Candidatus Phytoplasma solani TaxID=69896 RepID=UPI0004171FD2|nr:hypothetical protein [Candidatus Phytoplasma solani]